MCQAPGVHVRRCRAEPCFLWPQTLEAVLLRIRFVRHGAVFFEVFGEAQSHEFGSEVHQSPPGFDTFG